MGLVGSNPIQSLKFFQVFFSISVMAAFAYIIIITFNCYCWISITMKYTTTTTTTTTLHLNITPFSSLIYNYLNDDLKSYRELST